MTIPIITGAITFLCFAVFRLVGSRGPVHERRRGILTFPDILFTVPFLILVVYLFRNPPASMTLNYYVIFGLVSHSFCLLAACNFLERKSWTDSLPFHVQLLAHANLKAAKYRRIVRSTFWLGVTAYLGASVPNLRWTASIPYILYLMLIMGPVLVFRNRRFVTTCFDKKAKRFDVFISYKSEMANFAKRITDGLISAGKKPWFAEYLIRFHSRDKFQAAIDAGIDDCRRAILITSDSYFASSHCKSELAQLLEKHRQGKVQLLEITTPGEMTLQSSSATKITVPALSSESPELIKTVSKFVGARIRDTKTDRFSNRLSFSHLSVPFSIEAFDSVESKRSLLPVLDFGASAPSPPFRLKTRKGLLKWQFSLGPVMTWIEDGQFDKSLEPDLPSDDRLVYNVFRDLAVVWLANQAFECKGVHLFRMKQTGRKPHMGMTFRADKNWVRSYWIEYPHPNSNTPLTFCFWFFYRGTFRNFCALSETMESIVGTLQIESL